MTAASVGIGVSALMGMLLVCGFLGATPATDPWLVAELSGFLLAATWAARMIGLVRGPRAVDGPLRAGSTVSHLHGVSFRVAPHPTARAFVLGVARPRIVLTDTALRMLDPHALRAVLLHEEHHRRTRAPLRVAALRAWGASTRAPSSVRRLAARRLVQLEIEADRAAMARGARPSDLARALLVMEPGPVGAAFADASEERVRWLLDAGMPRRRAAPTLPVEWTPSLLALTVVLGCRLLWG